MDTKLKLISKRACPFAERTRIVLGMKGLAAEIEEIDVYNKPDWFTELSPLGKVPVLLHGDQSFYESTAINEYLDEKFDGPALVPNDPALRAKMRFWVQFDETSLAPAFYRLLLEQDGDHQISKREIYEGRLNTFERHALDSAAPFILGKSPSLADVTLYTHLSRLPVLQRARGVAVRAQDSPLSRWIITMSELDAVKQAAPSAADLEFDLKPYLDATVVGETARDMAGKT